MHKTNVICIFPGPKYRPDMLDFSARFEMLSEKFIGEIYSWSTDERFSDYKIGSFTYKGFICRNSIVNKYRLAVHIIKNALRYNKENKVDLILSYDPLFNGVLGVILKKIFKCKLIVELNSSDLASAIELENGSGIMTRIKVIIASKIRSLVLANADGIKLLTENQRESLEVGFKSKNVYAFHDFVPTNYFSDADNRMDPYILFVGYPFYRKGVDLLVKAFEHIADEFPDMKLVLIGHRLEEVAKKALVKWHENITFMKPMNYDALRHYFLNCYCFVLPSREEGMGRVLIEAMASGKAVVGARVGGIPALIKHNENGLLFDCGKSDDLAEILKRVLTDKDLAISLGKQGKSLVEERFSAEKYVEYFNKMVEDVCGETS